MYKRLALIVLLVVCGFTQGVYAQRADSLIVTNYNKLANTQAYKMSYIAVPLMTKGLITISLKDEVKGIRDEYVPNFDYSYDDYLQYLPGVAMIGLKAAGVESASSWSRMITADVFSVAILSSSVYLLKDACGVMRPDDSTSNSFPSGHTATAFAAATMLHKEYGKVNPWYSIGGYTLAAATGVGRILNNRHWISDVFFGAGVGIMSVELGYWITDLIFKDRGLNDIVEYERVDMTSSYVGLYTGFSIPINTYNLNDKSLALTTGVDIGVEGAYFFNEYVGIGGDITYSDMYVEYEGVEQVNPLNLMMTHAGGYFAYPVFGQTLTLDAKCLVGYSNYRDMLMDDGATVLGNRDGLSMKTGAAFTIRASDYFSLRFFADYCLANPFIANSSRVTQSVVLGNTMSIAF
ncbi:MAG: phosphatase PAP2 family protein [Bacteroidales bacterium]